MPTRNCATTWRCKPPHHGSRSWPALRLILDFDATDPRLHGDQEGRLFHGYYDHYCFLPLYVFCSRQLLSSLAYTLFEGLRRRALLNTRLATASDNTSVRLALVVRRAPHFLPFNV